jgi:hypothetical protein
VDAPPAGFDAFLMDPEGIVGIFRREVPNEVPRFKVVILRRQADGLMLLWAIGEDHELPPGDEPEPLVLQGRAVDVRRIVPRDNDETMRRAGMARETPAWHIELGERRGQRLSLLIQSDRTAVDLDEIEEILAPFDVWATADELPPAATEPR